VVGGDIPAGVWRRFMVAAHASLAVSDFPWLLPDPVVETRPDPRNGFYETLAAEFARTASEREDADEASPTPPTN